MQNAQKKKLISMQLGGERKNTEPMRRKNYEIGNFYYDLQEMVTKWNLKDLQEAISYILKTNSKTFAWLKKQLVPPDYSYLNYGKFISTGGNIDKILCWYALLIEENAKLLNSFCEEKSVFESLFINGEYEKAEKLLDEINQKYGYSLWGIDSKFALYEYAGGLEKNKEFLAKINTSTSDVWVTICAELFSFKAEKSINNRQYVHRVNNFLNGLEDDIESYFSEKLYPISEIDINDIYDILFFNSNLSIIDMYSVFIKICVRTLLEGRDTDIFEKVSKALMIINNIDDIVLYKLRWKCFGAKSLSERFMEEKEILYISDLYTTGKYEDVINLTQEWLDRKSNYFEIYEYYVKSFVMLNKSLPRTEEITVRSELIEAMYSAYVKGNETSKSYFSLSRLVRLFSNSNIGTELACYFSDKYMIGLNDILIKGKEFLSPFINIKYINAVPEKKVEIIEAFKMLNKTSSTVNLYKYLSNENGEIDLRIVEKNRRRWYQIKKGIICKNKEIVEQIKEWYCELEQEESVYAIYQKERLATELFYCYVDKGNYLEAEQVYVDSTIKSRFSTIRMDLDCIFSKLVIKTEEIKKSICTPIATYLYNRNDYTAIYAAVANFLKMNNVNKPSDLFELENDYNESWLVFFLKHVCVVEVLDSMINIFHTDEDVENERIEICRYLQNKDKDNASEYIEEISQILQNKKVMEGVKYLGDVKIDVDFAKIYAEHKEVFEDNYKRFQQMDQLEVEYATYDITNNRLYINVNEDKKKYNHVLLVFKEMFDDYRQEIAFGKFGLDSMLGTRIRHGCLQNQIRIAFESNSIAFVCKSTEDRTYLPTRTFEMLCADLESDIRSQLYEYLADFSRKVDDYIDKINADYIRIQIDEKNKNGLFYFTASWQELVYLMQEARKYQNVNLVRELFENYWIQKIELSIEIARNFFDNDVKNTFIMFLKELEEDISGIPEAGTVGTRLLDSISRSRTQLQKEISFVIDWFKLPSKQEYNDYCAEDLVDTCESINKRVIMNYERVNTKKIIDVKHKLSGHTFSYMIDILVILFTNAYYHSGYIDNPSELELELSITEDANELVLKMVNNLEKSVNIEELHEEIIDVKQKLDECIQKREYYNYEGKSGYIKICKILDYNMSCKSSLEFGMDDLELSYYVEIHIPQEAITVKKESSE